MHSTNVASLENSVSADMRLHIAEQIAQLERDRPIRVLYAAESGSRAWGFASPNSDYDVRFIYVPQPDWYQSVSHRRDVIERMLPGDLDLSGWELRKALRLFQRYNGALNEWLGSPIVYRETTETAARMREVLPSIFKPPAALHHYGSMAQSALERMPDIDGKVSSKPLCYLLRALFACRHVLEYRTQPPTVFATMLQSLAKSTEERQWIEAMLVAKAQAPEKALKTLSSEHRRALQHEIDAALAARARVARKASRQTDALDQLLQHAIASAWA